MPLNKETKETKPGPLANTLASLKKGITSSNYLLIAFLQMMLKMLMAQFREEIYYSFISCALFPKEQKGCRKEQRGAGDLLYIDQYTLNEKKIIWRERFQTKLEIVLEV